MKRTIAGIAIAIALTMGCSFASTESVSDMDIETIISESEQLVERATKIRVYGVVDMNVVGLYRQSFGLDDGSGIIPVEGRNVDMILRGGEPVVITGTLLKSDDRISILADSVEMALVRRAGRIPATVKDMLTAATAVGNDMSELQYELENSITVGELDNRYAQLFDELEQYNKAIANMVMSEIRDTMTNENLVTLENYLVDLKDDQKAYFGNALCLISEELVNLENKDHRVITDSINMIRQISCFMWC